jgi:leader peptidase (prepilin peptidase)/N-methyltransferase
MPDSTIPSWLWITAAALFGSLAGSFFNVVIYRMPRGESVVFPSSRCPSCGHRIRPWENIPVLSWVFLRGRCSQCRSGIGFQYPLVEAVTALAAGLLAWDFLRHPQSMGSALVFAYFALCVIPIAIIDIRYYLIPDILTLTGLPLALGASFFPGGLKPWESALGLAASGLFLWTLGAVAGKILKKEAMGFGDVKLLALAGACFGWQTALIGLAMASVLGTLAGLPLLLLRRLNAERHIPFGPFICLGVLVAARFGESLLDWFWNLGMAS